MGREVKRVPMDFKWPLKAVWGGYRNPYYVHCVDCPSCSGNGQSPEYNNLVALWYGSVPFKPEDTGSIPFTPEHPEVRSRAEWNVQRSPEYYGTGEAAIQREARRLSGLFNAGWNHHLDADDVAVLVKEDRLRDLAHIPNLTPQIVNDWSIATMGHDGINQYLVVKAKAERLGLPIECIPCGGEGAFWDFPENKQLAEDWKSVDPPDGDGWQMWETTTEGSPMSPVFATPEELAKWLADTNASSFGKQGATYEQWLAMIVGPGWATSAFSSSETGMISGVEAVSAHG